MTPLANPAIPHVYIAYRSLLLTRRLPARADSTREEGGGTSAATPLLGLMCSEAAEHSAGKQPNQQRIFVCASRQKTKGPFFIEGFRSWLLLTDKLDDCIDSYANPAIPHLCFRQEQDCRGRLQHSCQTCSRRQTIPSKGKICDRAQRALDEVNRR